MKTRERNLVLLLLAAGVGGCGYDPAEETVQRDVYTRLEDCIADWGNSDLCAQTLKSEDAAAAAAAQSGGGSHAVIVPQYIYSGPAYGRVTSHVHRSR